MPTLQPRYGKEEFARRGDEIYERAVRPVAEGTHLGEFAAIDIESGEYEIDRDELVASDRLRERVPDAQVWLRKIGATFTRRIRDARSAVSPQFTLGIMPCPIVIRSSLSVFMIVFLLGCSPTSTPPKSGSHNETPATNRDREIVVGGLYATKNEDGTFAVMKVLVVDDFAVHLRSYANHFAALPADLDPSILKLGSISDSGGFGIGHFPVAKEGFWNDDPIFLKKVPVANDELEGYRVYLEAMRGSQ